MRRKGFTLLELAIVLVVIGLLIALVMRGMTLQSSAKVKRTAGDIRNIHTAVMVYYGKKGVYPGDTDQDGFIDNDADAWDSLAHYSIAFKKPSPYGTDYKLDTLTVSSVKRNVVRVSVPDADARTEIDKLIDDGFPTSGALITVGTDTLVYVIE
ncbi:MAG: prepilin-type N-terminal cleavage/methylation domain-containing protein [bacterium]|nr:prepilin-type N-terminal cleavage/methylation domain-containing protein [bacterium]